MIRVRVSAKSPVTRAGLESLVRGDPRFELVTDGRLETGNNEPFQVLLADAVEVRGRIHIGDVGHASLVLLVGELSRAEVRRLLRAGVRALLPRDSGEQEITAAIEAAAAGLAVVAPEILETLLPMAGEVEETESLSVSEPLTSRESEVLAMLAEGAGNKEIASRLHISEHTAKFHVSSILAKLGAATRTEAVSRGYKEGLIVM